MYTPEIFAENDKDNIKEILNNYSLGTLISLDENGAPQADHLPFYLLENDDQWTLIAHFAKANPLANYIDGARVLVIFQGADGYVSPNWYPSKQIHHRHVPTWNYQTVHLRGTAKIFNDIKGLMRAVGTLTNIHEATQPTPWKMKDAPRDYLDEEIGGIVGLSIKIDEIVAKFKLSQNREPEDLAGTVAGLQDSGNVKLAEAVQKAYKNQT
ncbi:transcriptional regulator [Moraxella caviae]|uniref:Protease synthase and sporulation protein PAI 2 n=1 Tax=Moraxella caviae TaxID=34060 RepID=A0A1T0A2B8_9GAMM|nr:FMN-binding negative transcriptional regulator [Moraxella caviae]OOR89788.1 transcriptional regulator [Moraxella caviae]STZ10703.1 Protease synthase and sporulation protein PAI 2 [Moraxella caviae]